MGKSSWHPTRPTLIGQAHLGTILLHWYKTATKLQILTQKALVEFRQLLDLRGQERVVLALREAHVDGSGEEVLGKEMRVWTKDDVHADAGQVRMLPPVRV